MPVAGADDEPAPGDAAAAEATGGAPGGPSPVKEVTVMHDNALAASVGAEPGGAAAAARGATPAADWGRGADGGLEVDRELHAAAAEAARLAAAAKCCAAALPTELARATCDATVAVAQWATKLARAQSAIAQRTMGAWDLEVSAVFDGGRD